MVCELSRNSIKVDTMLNLKTHILSHVVADKRKLRIFQFTQSQRCIKKLGKKEEEEEK